MRRIRSKLTDANIISTLALVLVLAGGTAYAVAGDSGPSRNKAQSYAHRTFIRQKFAGKQRFMLAGPSRSVTANDGSRLTAFPIVIEHTADGAGQAVLLFRNDHFVRWASRRVTVKLGVGGRHGRRILVKYAVYRGHDAICCPSGGLNRVTYRWNGSRIVPSGTAPKSWGHRLERLHLAPRR